MLGVACESRRAFRPIWPEFQTAVMQLRLRVTPVLFSLPDMLSRNQLSPYVEENAVAEIVVVDHLTHDAEILEEGCYALNH